MFTNTKTGQRAKELKGYKSETEENAKARLEAAGWSFQGVEYDWDEPSKTFSVKEGDSDSDGDEEVTNDE